MSESYLFWSPQSLKKKADNGVSYTEGIKVIENYMVEYLKKTTSGKLAKM